MNNKIEEIRKRAIEVEQMINDGEYLITSDAKDLLYLLSEYDRLIAGYEVLASSELTLHPSELRDFSKKILKGQKPYEL